LDAIDVAIGDIETSVDLVIEIAFGKEAPRSACGCIFIVDASHPTADEGDPPGMADLRGVCANGAAGRGSDRRCCCWLWRSFVMA